MSLWWNRRKKHTITFKVDEYEMMIVDELSKEFKEDRSEVVRRALWTIRILYDPALCLKDALIEQDLDKPLCDVLKPLPELAHQLGLEIKLWRKSLAQAAEKEEE